MKMSWYTLALGLALLYCGGLCGAKESGALKVALRELLQELEQREEVSGHTISGETILEICDGDGDRNISLREYFKCLHDRADTVQSFLDLDTDGDRLLDGTELADFTLTMPGTGECYGDLVSSCSTQYAMYQRVRGINTPTICMAFERFGECVLDGPESSCEDPSVKSLVAASTWTDEKLESVCVTGTDSASPALDPTVACSVAFVRSLQAAETPCEALTAFYHCLKEVEAEGEAGPGARSLEEPEVRGMSFQEVAQLAGCDPEQEDEKSERALGHW